MAEARDNSQPVSTAGYCTAWTDEQLAAFDREWAAEGPAEPAPPIANVHLVVELTTGLDAIQDFDFQGRTIRLRPTPYPTALRLLAWMQQLERLEAMGKLLGEHLQELRDCYQEIADLAGSLVVDPQGANPFLEAQPVDFHRILAAALSSGNELPLHVPRSTDTISRYDAVYYLYRYFEKFGPTPGMVVLEAGRPQPASWRHFANAMTYLRRAEAESALQAFGAMASAQGGGDGARKWLEAQTQATGQP